MTAMISVVMPVRNEARGIGRAIESIRSQTFAGWELLIVDDGSTDATGSIIAEAARRDNRIRRWQSNERGIVGSLNLAFSRARGRFIARMDGDDLSLPARFETQMRYLRDNPTLAAVGSAYEMIDDHDRILRTQRPPSDPLVIRKELRTRNPMCHPAMMFRREAIEQVPGPYRRVFDLAEDYDLWLRVAERFSLGNVPEVLLQYRRGAAAIDPQRVIRQTIGRVACQWSAEARCRGETDPATQWSSIEEDGLIKSGVPASRLRHQIRRTLLNEARRAKRHPSNDLAIRLSNAAREFAPRGEGPWRAIDYQIRRLRSRSVWWFPINHRPNASL